MKQNIFVDSGEQQQCTLLSGVQTYLVQLILGFVALSSLWYKRTVERPKRSFEIWSLDVGKQGIGAVCGHIMNMLIAIVLPPLTDECVWYFLNFVADSTFGTILALAFLRLQQEFALFFEWSSIQQSGDYGTPPSYRVWLIQLFAWLSIIICAKGIVLSCLIVSSELLGHFGNWLFTPLKQHPFGELIVVMVICPCFLNIMQFWIQDSFLKRGGTFTTQRITKTNKQFDGSLQKSLLTHEQCA